MAVVACAIAAAMPAHSDTPRIPEGAKPLTDAEILALLDGKTFSFIAYDEPVTGTSTWDSKSGTVSGDYVWKESLTGTYESEWFIADGKNCTRQPNSEPVCQIIYADGDGFIEVNAEGEIHAESIPK